MKIVAVSDLHGYLPKIEPCDLAIIAGDVCPWSDHRYQYQAAWLGNYFRRWLDRIPAKNVVGIAGNHDWVFQTHPECVPNDLRWTYLQDSETTINGLKIYGSPWQPRFHDWAFNADPPELAEKWAAIPDDVDILVTHGPPRWGLLDVTDDGRRVGCPQLMWRITELRKLKLHICGHIHSGNGWTTLNGEVTLANVSYLNEQYQPAYKPFVFEI